MLTLKLFITFSLLFLPAWGSNFFFHTLGKSTTTTTKVSFTYTGADQSFTVPSGVTSLTIKVWGAGGTGPANESGNGGSGGFSQGTLAVSSGNVLKIVVGQGGTSVGSATYGGGGIGSYRTSYSPAYAGSGGGYSGVFLTSVAFANAKILAGGGGGAGKCGGTMGGAAGGTSGSASPGRGSPEGGGGGGTQSAGGTATGSGTAGSQLAGGNGGTDGAGGGGGGYYGGGGGASTCAGGGGGSGYLSAGLTTTTITSGSDGDGSGSSMAAPNNTDADYVSGVGLGGPTAGTGGNGLVIITY